MNILIDYLPQYVTIGNEEYKINTNFRTCILFSLLMEDESLIEEEKIINALELFYSNEENSDKYNLLGENANKAVEKMLWFYICGKNNEGQECQTKSTSKIKRIYDYEIDDMLIYSAFLDQYNIDLNSIKYLHWWKFKALFEGIKKDCKFSEVMSYRAIDLKDIKDPEQKKFYKEMQTIYKLPEKINIEEKERNEKIIAALKGDGDLSKIE